MLLRNYDNIMASKTLVGSLSTTNYKTGDEFADGYINVKNNKGVIDGWVDDNVDGRICPLAYIIGVGNFYSGTRGASYFVVGSGSTPPTYDDYKLESAFNGSQLALNSSSLVIGEILYNAENSTYSRTLSYDYQAKEDLTVQEIGVEYCHNGNDCLVYREVLDTPVSLTTGQYLKVSITTTVSSNPNKPADYSVNAEVV